MHEEWLKYGILGLCVVGLGAYVMYRDKEHKKERKEWMEMMEKQAGKMESMNHETNKVLRENTNILSGLKTLLEIKK